MEQLLLMMMQTCTEYAGKSGAMPLTEYEMLMYEQICRAVTLYMKSYEISLKRILEKEEEGEATNVDS